MTEEPPETPGAEVVRLGVRFKAPPDPDGPMLSHSGSIPFDGRCNHRWTSGSLKQVSYLIREGETEVECGQCGTRLDPMFVLKLLAGLESRWLETRRAYQAEMARLEERQRTKCRHCGQMTRISHS